MNAPVMTAEIPAFLERREPDATYAWWSTGRLMICKGDQSLSLSKDDLRALKRYFDQFAGEIG